MITPRQAQHRFKPYPAYKDSGVEWLGAIPAHWEVVRLKRVCTLAYGEALPGEARDDGDIEVYGSNGPVGTHVQANTLAPCLVIGRKGSFGKVNFSYSPVFAIDTTFFVDRRFTKADIRWLYYVLIDARLDRATKDSAVPGLDREDAYGREVCLCPSSEQHAIAAFLDRETAKIDALVEKKERLIALLQEKRTALISHAVTKGLDPSVPMKDSGVEWLGATPAHWEVKPLKALLCRNDGGVWGDEFDDEGVIVLRSTEQTVDGNWKIDNPARRKLTIREASAGRLALNDLVVTKSSGSELHIGKTSIVDERVAGLGCCFSNFMQRLRIAPPSIPRLYWYFLNCPVAREQLVYLSSTTTGLGNLNGSILGAIRVPVAPEPEQRAIAAFLDRETAKIDALIARVREAIERLKEHRTALISAAVTGKIDVRKAVSA